MKVTCKTWGALKVVLINRGKGLGVLRCTYMQRNNCANSVVWSRDLGMRLVERRRVNILRYECLRSMIGVICQNSVRKGSWTMEVLKLTSRYKGCWQADWTSVLGTWAQLMSSQRQKNDWKLLLIEIE